MRTFGVVFMLIATGCFLSVAWVADDPSLRVLAVGLMAALAGWGFFHEADR